MYLLSCTSQYCNNNMLQPAHYAVGDDDGYTYLHTVLTHK